MALLVVADHTIFSCHQWILFWGLQRLLLSFCGGWVVGVVGFAKSFLRPTQPLCWGCVTLCWGWGCDNWLLVIERLLDGDREEEGSLLMGHALPFIHWELSQIDINRLGNKGARTDCAIAGVNIDVFSMSFMKDDSMCSVHFFNRAQRCQGHHWRGIESAEWQRSHRLNNVQLR